MNRAKPNREASEKMADEQSERKRACWAAYNNGSIMVP